MKMSTTLVKHGGDVPQLTIDKDFTEQEHEQAYERMMADLKNIVPLDHVIPCEIAANIEPYVMRAKKLTQQSRDSVYRIIKFLSEPENFQVSRKKMCEILDINISNFYRLGNVFPGMWALISCITRFNQINVSDCLVDGATCQAAIHGQHGDRRLYYEVFRGLREKGSGSSGGVSINFIVDNVHRPQPKVIDVTPKK